MSTSRSTRWLSCCLCRGSGPPRAHAFVAGLDANQIVLSDRYADATVAYQGAGRGFEAKLIQEIVQLATGGLTPELTLPVRFISGRIGGAHSASRSRKNTDRLDIEDAAFHTRVRNAYLEIAKAEAHRFRVIDARNSTQETHRKVMDIVIPFLQGRGFLGQDE